MLLASVDDLRESLGFDDMPDIINAITAAMNTAEAILSATLATNFKRRTKTDLFYVREPVFDNDRSVETRFLLSGTLLVPDTFTAQYTQSVDQIGTGDAISGMLLLPELGVAVDYQTRYCNHYVSLTYECGISADPGNEESYDLAQVPDWLSRAATLATLLELESSPSFEEAGIKQDTKTLTTQLNAILAPRQRYEPLALLPMNYGQ